MSGVRQRSDQTQSSPHSRGDMKQLVTVRSLFMKSNYWTVFLCSWQNTISKIVLYTVKTKPVPINLVWTPVSMATRAGLPRKVGRRVLDRGQLNCPNISGEVFQPVSFWTRRPFSRENRRLTLQSLGSQFLLRLLCFWLLFLKLLLSAETKL